VLVVVIIEQNPGRGAYDVSNLRALLDAVAVVINRKPESKVVRGPLDFVKKEKPEEHYRFRSLDDMARYMLDFSVAAPRANQQAPKLQFGRAHGMLHFGGDPIANKTKWSLTESAACTAMELEIRKHIGRMRKEAQLHEISGWDSWWIGAQSRNDIGKYSQRGVRGGKSTDQFSIQAQVDWVGNAISYHGFPDERLVRFGCGRAKNQLACTNLCAR